MLFPFDCGRQVPVSDKNRKREIGIVDKKSCQRSSSHPSNRSAPNVADSDEGGDIRDFFCCMFSFNWQLLLMSQVKKSEGEPFDFVSKFNLPILNALWNITAGFHHRHCHHNHHHPPHHHPHHQLGPHLF